MRNQVGNKGESIKTKVKMYTGKTAVRLSWVEWNGRSSKLSSEMLKWKWTKENESNALVPEKKFKRESPVEQLRERSRVERKETISSAK